MSDSLDLLLAALRSVGALTLLLLLPGLTLGRVLAPGATTPLGALGRAAGVSLLTTSVACTLLAVAGVLRPVPVIAVVGRANSGAGCWSEATGRPDLRRRRARIGWLAAGLGVVALAPAGRRAVPGDRRRFASCRTRRQSGTTVRCRTGWPRSGRFRRRSRNGAPSAPSTPTTCRSPRTPRPPSSSCRATAGPRMEIYRLGLLLAAGLVAAVLFRRWVSSMARAAGRDPPAGHGTARLQVPGFQARDVRPRARPVRVVGARPGDRGARSGACRAGDRRIGRDVPGPRRGVPRPGGGAAGVGLARTMARPDGRRWACGCRNLASRREPSPSRPRSVAGSGRLAPR